MMEKIPSVMKKYNPNERYFGYHLIYYFDLIDIRSTLDEDISQLSDAELSLAKKLKKSPINIRLDDLKNLYEGTAQMNTLLEQIANNIHQRWKDLKLEGHELFEFFYTERTEAVREYYEGYGIRFYLLQGKPFPPNPLDVVEQLEEELGIDRERHNRMITRPFHQKYTPYSVRYKFSSVNELIAKTKAYLTRWPQVEVKGYEKKPWKNIKS